MESKNNLNQADSNKARDCHPPKLVPFLNGVEWVRTGATYFSRDPGNWILICIVGFIIALPLLLIPIVKVIAAYSTPFWTAGLMLGCRAQDEGAGLNINHLFAGFTTKFKPLLMVSCIIGGLSYAIGAFVEYLGVTFFELGAILQNPLGVLNSIEAMLDLSLLLLIYMFLLIPVMAMAWFAPVLIVLDNVPVIRALNWSFKACVINFIPMISYSFVLLILFFVGALPIMLGLLIVMPIFYGSIYRSYHDIFIH